MKNTPIGQSVLPEGFSLPSVTPEVAPGAAQEVAPTPIPNVVETGKPAPLPKGASRKLGLIGNLCLFGLGAAIVYALIYGFNFMQPFKVSDRLDHQGPWYRQAALAPADWLFNSRKYVVRHDFWGKPYVVYTVGSRTFVQRKSDSDALEVYPAVVNK